ncbi:MAG: hypothetical protein ABT01_04580 [Clostridium sp. SCN 57-10]|nr:MAG: hypothetical protein ABT01_04580 [Clostridium sp. SCN 57-10]
MGVRLIALDLDGTVLRDDKSISAATLDALAKCRKRGMHIAVATARSEKAAEAYIKQLNPDLVVSNGGALVRAGGRVVHECKLPADVAQSIIRELMDARGFVSMTAELPSGYYATWDPPYTGDYAHTQYSDFRSPLTEDVYKITAELLHAHEAEAVATRYPICSMLAFSGENWYRFAHRDAGKMAGVKAAAAHCAVDLCHVAAFGDDVNDLDMLRGCGIGVAMGNAVSEVKAAADYICDTNERDGVAEWLERFAL